MNEFGILILIAQIALTVHAVRNSKNIFWIVFIIFIPLLGCAVYFFTQVMPEMMQSRSVKNASQSVVKTLDPDRNIRQIKADLDGSDSIENRSRLADAYMEAGRYDEAIPHYEDCLRGINKHDPHIMLKIAEAEFARKNSERAKEILEKIIETNPDFKSHDGHLLYARVLESLGQDEHAIEEYEILADTYPGEEARVRFGLLLKEKGQAERANHYFNETLKRIKRAPAFYRQKEKHWIEIAKLNVN